MIPGKQYTPEQMLALVWAKRWIIVLPCLVGCAFGIITGKLIPDQFRSETLVLVVPQRVPESYVRSTVTSRIEDRVRSIREQILSRSRLERIVGEFDLYKEERQRLPMEDVIEGMRDRVTTRVVREDAFSITFTASDPRVAQQVTARLASLFSEENTRDREVQAENTNQFLQTQLDDARQRLTEHERRVEEYRRRYSGELPAQVQGNLQAIQNAEMQIQTQTQSLNNDRDRRLLLERQLLEAENTVEAPSIVVSTAPGAAAMTVAQQLEAAEATVRGLQTRLTPEHPDLVQAKLTVQRLQRQLAAERSAAPGETTSRPSTAEVVRRARVADLRVQIEALDRQIAGKVAEEGRLRSVIATYRGRVEAAPKRETELVALTRDYETIQRQYQSLLQSHEDSKVAANLERRQIGEQFRVLDPARVPGRPFTPNRLLITAAGATAGLVLGLAIGAFSEFRDRSLKTREDVISTLAIPVIAVLPPVWNVVEQRSRRRQRIAVQCSVFLTLILIVGAVAWRRFGL